MTISEESILSALQQNSGEGKIDYVAIAKQLKERFESSNTDKSNHFIHIDQLRSIIDELNINAPQEVIEEAIMVGDVNEDGINIEFYEFIGAIVSDLEDEDEQGDIRRAFELFEQKSSSSEEENPVIVGADDLLRALRSSFRPVNEQQLELLLDGFESVRPNEYNFGNFLVLYHAAEDVI